MKKTEDIELRNEEIQELLEAIPNRIIRFGNSAILLFVIIIASFSLSSFADKYDNDSLWT